MVLLTALVGSTIGLLMGTIIKPDQISLMFTLIFTPLLFTGCTLSLGRTREHSLVPNRHAPEPADLRL